MLYGKEYVNIYNGHSIQVFSNILHIFVIFYKLFKDLTLVNINSSVMDEALETLDIVQLIERNPLTRLETVGDYQSRLVTRICDRFNTQEQKLFVASFYCYLNYDIHKDFVIDLSTIWKWLGFGRINEAKRLLVKYFTQDTDYVVKSLIAPNGAIKKGHGGDRKSETMIMTVHTFKKFCIRARTAKADEIHDYFIALEEIVMDIVQEEAHDMVTKLEIKDKALDMLEKEHKRLQKNHNNLKMKKNYYKFNTETPGVYAVHNLMEGENAPIKIGKYGTGEKNGLDERLASYRTNAPCTVVDFVIQCESSKDASNLETYILKWFSEDRTSEVINKSSNEIKNITLKLINLLDITYSLLENKDIEKFNEQPLVNFISNKKTDFQCLICKSYYNNKHNLKRHYIDIHSRSDLAKEFDKQTITNFKCSICNKYLSGKESLKRHIILKHNDSNIHNLLNDLKIKQKETEFKCYECKKYLSSRDTLRKHIIVVHKDKDLETVMKNSLPLKILETNYQCPECNKYVSNRQCLIRHIISKHPEVNPNKIVYKGSKDDIKYKIKTDYQCSECNMYLSSKICLKRHFILKHK